MKCHINANKPHFATNLHSTGELEPQRWLYSVLNAMLTNTTGWLSMWSMVKPAASLWSFRTNCSDNEITNASHFLLPASEPFPIRFLFRGEMQHEKPCGVILGVLLQNHHFQRRVSNQQPTRDNAAADDGNAIICWACGGRASDCSNLSFSLCIRTASLRIVPRIREVHHVEDAFKAILAMGFQRW